MPGIVPWWPVVCNGVGAGVGTCWRKKPCKTCNLRAFLELDVGLMLWGCAMVAVVCNGVGAGVGTCWRNKKAMQNM